MRNEKGVRARALFVEKDAVGVCIAPDRVMMDGRTAPLLPKECHFHGRSFTRE